MDGMSNLTFDKGHETSCIFLPELFTKGNSFMFLLDLLKLLGKMKQNPKWVVFNSDLPWKKVKNHLKQIHFCFSNLMSECPKRQRNLSFSPQPVWSKALVDETITAVVGCGYNLRLGYPFIKENICKAEQMETKMII